MKRFGVITLLLTALFLAACSKEIDVDVYTDETWDVRQNFSFNPDLFPSVGGDILPGFDLELNIGAVTDEFLQYGMEQLVWAYQRKGIQADWSRQDLGGDVVFNFHTRGQGWHTLRDWGLGGDIKSLTAELIGEYSQSEYIDFVNELYGTVILDSIGDGQVRLLIYPSELTAEYPNFGTTFRLHAGQIITSNASSVRGGTATWINPVTIEAIFIPAARFGDLVIVISVLGGCALLVGVGWLVYQTVFSSPPRRRPLTQRHYYQRGRNPRRR